MKRLEDKLDKVIETQSEINVTLVKQSVILEEHVKRTNLLEQKLEPVEKHVAMVQGAIKVVMALGGGGIVAEMIRYLKGM